MTFIRQTTEVDLGSTSIENIFINDFMPAAPGAYVKVYLMGYKVACDGDSNLRSNNKMLARNLNMPMEDVLSAWTFWESKGIIKKTDPDKLDKTDFNVVFLSLRQLFLDNNYHSNAPRNKRSSAKEASASPSALKDDSETGAMFDAIEGIVGRPLSINEAVQISEYMEAYSMKPSMILEAYGLASEKRGIHDSKYIGGILKNWYDKGIFSEKALQAHREEQSVMQSHYNRIFDSLGFAGRNPSKAEKAAMDQWLLEWGFPIEMVLKACENTIYAARPSIRYIHSILSAWNKSGIRSLEDLANQDVQNQQKELKKPQQPSSRFHNYKERTLEYTEEELEELLKNKNKA